MIFRTGKFKTISALALILMLSTCSLFSPPVEREQETHKELVERILSRPQPRFPSSIYDPNADKVAELYREEKTRKEVLAHFTELTGSERIARVILDNALGQGVPVNLAFALAWAESRYKTGITSQNKNKSVDRGLFQLNSTSFPQLSAAEIFDPDTNARHGLSYLRYCLSYSGNEVVALAMYNAGLPRVAKAKTPPSTFIYVEKILAKRDEIALRLSERMGQPL